MYKPMSSNLSYSTVTYFITSNKNTVNSFLLEL